MTKSLKPRWGSVFKPA